MKQGQEVSKNGENINNLIKFYNKEQEDLGVFLGPNKCFIKNYTSYFK